MFHSLSTPAVLPELLHNLGEQNGLDILTQILSGTRDCVQVLDLAGRLLWMNEQARIRLATEYFDSVERCLWADLWQQQYKLKALDALEQTRAGHAARFESSFCNERGELTWWDVSVSPFCDPAADSHPSHPRYLICVSREITERKQTELALESRREQLQLVADNVPALMAYVDAKGNYTWANRVYEEWYGLGAADMVGRSALTVLHENVGERYAEQLRPYLERALRGENVSFEATHSFGGTRRDLRLTYSPDFAADGSVRGFVVQVTDVSEERRRESELRASEQGFRTLAATLPSVVWTAKANGELDYLSERFSTMTGMQADQGLGSWHAVIHPDDRTEARLKWETAVVNGLPLDVRYRTNQVIGAGRWVLTRALPQRDESGAIFRWVGVTTDIHDQVTAEQALRESERRYRLLFEDNPLPMWTYSPETLRFTSVNDTAVRVYGYSRAEFLDMRVTDIRPPEDVAAVLHRLHNRQPGMRGPVRHRRKDGSILWVEVTTHPISMSEGELSFAVVKDVTETVRLHEELRNRAQHDALTGLPNHSLLAERFEGIRQLALKSNQKLAIFAIDFDRFKQINDHFGHHVGDEFLKVSSSRLQRALRPTDTLARIGGDEFAALAGPVDTANDCLAIAERMLSSLGTETIAGGLQLSSSVSVGVAVFPDDGECLNDLIRRADYGLYQAKRSGRNCYRRQSPGETLGVEEAMQIEQSLRQAPKEGYLVLHYQPLFTSQGAVQSLEALLRLNDPELGLVSPARFIPIAEESGLINSIGTWVLHEACRQLAQWRAEGRSLIPIAINVSAAQFSRGDFAPEVQRVLSEYGLAPDLLELELTETVLMEDIDRSREQLSTLRQIGVRVAMDDFGTGYSSLSYLDALPLDAIKIDRSFIKKIGRGQSSAILKSIVELGKCVGLTVVAEGVETEEQRSALVQLHCDHLQGFLLARPAPANEITRLLDRHTASGQAGAVQETFHTPAPQISQR